ETRQYYDPPSRIGQELGACSQKTCSRRLKKPITAVRSLTSARSGTGESRATRPVRLLPRRTKPVTLLINLRSMRYEIPGLHRLESSSGSRERACAGIPRPDSFRAEENLRKSVLGRPTFAVPTVWTPRR